MLAKIRSFLEKVNHVERVILGWFFLFLTALIMVQIVIRTFKVGNIPWLEELSRLIVIEAGTLAACIVTTERSHLGLDFIAQRLPKKIYGVVSGVLNIGCCAMLIWLSTECYALVMKMIPVNMRYAALPFPKWIMYVPMTIFLFTMGIRFFLIGLEDLTSIRKKADDGAQEDTK